MGGIGKSRISQGKPVSKKSAGNGGETKGTNGSSRPRPVRPEKKGNYILTERADNLIGGAFTKSGPKKSEGLRAKRDEKLAKRGEKVASKREIPGRGERPDGSIGPKGRPIAKGDRPVPKMRKGEDGMGRGPKGRMGQGGKTRPEKPAMGQGPKRGAGPKAGGGPKRMGRTEYGVM